MTQPDATPQSAEPARSRRKKKRPGVLQWLLRIVLLAVLFSLPWILYQASCGQTKTRSLKEAYGQEKVFGAPVEGEDAPPAAGASD